LRHRFRSDGGHLSRANSDHVGGDSERAIEAVATAHLIQQVRVDLFAIFRLLGHVPLLLQHRDRAVDLSHIARDAGGDSAGCVVHKASLSLASALVG
jgi:hypothetical protein